MRSSASLWPRASKQARVPAGEALRDLGARKTTPGWRITSSANKNQIVAFGCRGDGHCCRRGPRASLGAAADVEHDALAFWQHPSPIRRVGAYRTKPMRASWRARTTGDAQPRIAGIDDQSELRDRLDQ